MAGYSSASWAIGVLFSDCITKDTPPPFTSPNTTFGYTPTRKRPLAVAPMSLKNPDRIAGLLCVLVWALMVLALMERQARRGLRGEPLYGLYPEGRPRPAPTGPALIQGLSGLGVVIVQQGGEINRR